VRGSAVGAVGAGRAMGYRGYCRRKSADWEALGERTAGVATRVRAFFTTDYADFLDYTDGWLDFGASRLSMRRRGSFLIVESAVSSVRHGHRPPRCTGRTQE